MRGDAIESLQTMWPASGWNRQLRWASSRLHWMQSLDLAREQTGNRIAGIWCRGVEGNC